MSERPCDPAELAAVENRLGVRLPVALRALYANGNGRFDELGQTWVIWPIDRVVERNQVYWREGWLDRSLVSFGDDGTGDPFCVRADGSSEAVARWSMIERQPYELYESIAAFTTSGWRRRSSDRRTHRTRRTPAPLPEVRRADPSKTRQSAAVSRVRELVGELRAEVPSFVARFEELYGYPPGDHVVGDSDSVDAPEGTTTAWTRLPAEWREFLVECSEISLPDLWNGVFIGPARWIQALSSEVEAAETDAGPVPVIAVCADGGGGSFGATNPARYSTQELAH